jgi:hypothetical protein
LNKLGCPPPPPPPPPPGSYAPAGTIRYPAKQYPVHPCDRLHGINARRISLSHGTLPVARGNCLAEVNIIYRSFVNIYKYSVNFFSCYSCTFSTLPQYRRMSNHQLNPRTRRKQENILLLPHLVRVKEEQKKGRKEEMD